MSHVDDGELTAYADGAYPQGDADAQRIEVHLALCVNCRNRLEQARALSGRAAEILAIATPVEVVSPDFEHIRAAADARPRRRTTMPMTWAATVILALGIGWFGRGALYSPDQVRLSRSQPRAETAADMNAASEAALADQSAQPETQEAPAAAPPATHPAPGTRPAPEPATRPAPATATAPATAAASAADEAKTSPPAAEAAAAAAVEYLSAAEAERRGVAVRLIPELEVMRIGLRGDDVEVEQKLPDGTIITVAALATERRREGDLAANRAAAAELAAQAPGRAEMRRDAGGKALDQLIGERRQVNSVLVTRGTERLRITGALPPDSLRVLAAKVR